MNLAAIDTRNFSHSPAERSAVTHDRWLTAVGMGLTAIAVGLAIHIKDGNYEPTALGLLTAGLVFAVAAIALHANSFFESIFHKALLFTLVLGILLNVALLADDVITVFDDIKLARCLLVIGAMAFLCLLPSGKIKHVAIFIMLVGFFFAGRRAFSIHDPNPGIDVFHFQQQASQALLHRQNPYSTLFPSIYPPGTRFYGPGVVDDHNIVTYGFPYPPLMLLMALPGYILGGDCRYSELMAMILSAGLMAYARPGRLGALVAGMYLLMPRNLYVLNMAWTEPLLLLNFSLAMFCACRWRKALPYALGLFFATKQYSILALPIVWLLLESRGLIAQLFILIAKAALVALIVTLPFFLWNRREFMRAVVFWQFVQPFRTDALSYLNWFRLNGIMSWIFKTSTGLPHVWIPLVGVIPAMVLALTRAARSPAGFAAGVTLVNFAFFALNKQAFCNYYFFIAATACWSVAAFARPAIHGAAQSSR